MGAKISEMSDAQLEENGYISFEIDDLRTMSESIDIRLDVSRAFDEQGWQINTTHIVNNDVLDAYGWIERVIDFDDITSNQDLYTKAKEYLENVPFKKHGYRGVSSRFKIR